MVVVGGGGLRYEIVFLCQIVNALDAGTDQGPGVVGLFSRVRTQCYYAVLFLLRALFFFWSANGLVIIRLISRVVDIWHTCRQ